MSELDYSSAFNAFLHGKNLAKSYKRHSKIIKEKNINQSKEFKEIKKVKRK